MSLCCTHSNHICERLLGHSRTIVNKKDYNFSTHRYSEAKNGPRIVHGMYHLIRADIIDLHMSTTMEINKFRSAKLTY